MTDKEKVKAYDEALERARKMLNMILDNELLGFPDQIREIFPQLRESEEKQSMTRKEAIDKVYGMIGTAEQHEALEFLVPEVRELRESYDKQQEDKRIRKEIISALKFANDGGVYDKHITYLENQKPADLSEMMVHKEPYIAPVSTPMVADERKPVECIDFYDEFYKVYTGPKNILAYANMFVKKLGYIPIDIHELSACVYYVIKHIEEDTKASQKEQKPSEWSEKDSLHLTNAILSAEKEWGSESYTANWLKSLPERFNLQPKEERSEYDGNMDKECIKLCNVLNSIPSVNTFESCCGHLKDRYSVWFFCNDTIAISRLGRSVERNYSDGKWELVVDSTDTHPTGVFWLRSKVPFQDYDEMEESVNELCVGIQYWFNAKFDSYFNGDSCK